MSDLEALPDEAMLRIANDLRPDVNALVALRAELAEALRSARSPQGWLALDRSKSTEHYPTWVEDALVSAVFPVVERFVSSLPQDPEAADYQGELNA